MTLLGGIQTTALLLLRIIDGYPALPSFHENYRTHNNHGQQKQNQQSDNAHFALTC